MKSIKRNSKFLSLFMSGLMLFVSCESNDIAEENLPLQEGLESSSFKYSGPELFNSIVFGDGELADSVVALQDVVRVEEMTSEKLEEYRQMQTDAASFLLKQDPNYFVNFQRNIYSGNPETIRKSIIKAGTDIKPWLDQVLQPYDISVEEVSERVKNGESPESLFDVSESRKGGFIVAVVVAAVVAAVAVWVVVVSSVAIYASNKKKSNTTLNTVSIQVAEHIITL